MEENMKEVRFDRYCKLCQHKDLPEQMEPCNECLETGAREGSVKPINYESAEHSR